MTHAICVVYSPRPREVREWHCLAESGATVGDVLLRSGILAELTQQDIAVLECGVWGRKVPLAHVLRADDRVEVYRPLQVDPKVARRERFVRQGAKSAGLFTKRRAGAKAGY